MSSLVEMADQAHAEYAAARGKLLRAVAKLRESEEWKDERAGAATFVAWVEGRWQLTPATARELVRDAQRLAERPALSEALSEGSVSVDQAKAIWRLSEPAGSEDAEWLEVLGFWPIRELDREARKQTARRLARHDGGVWLRMAPTRDERHMRGEFQVDFEDGAALQAVLDARVPADTKLADWDHASAQALMALARDAAGQGRGRRQPTVLVSVTEDTLAGRPGSEGVAAVGFDGVAAVGSSGSGFVGAETARRLACDAEIRLLYHDPDGKLTGVDRHSRYIPADIRRAVIARDGGMCTFPGCTHTRDLQLHHRRFFAQGGPTAIHNLETVCWPHHMLVHEGGWRIEGPAGPHATWIQPDGTPYQPRTHPAGAPSQPNTRANGTSRQPDARTNGMGDQSHTHSNGSHKQQHTSPDNTSEQHDTGSDQPKNQPEGPEPHPQHTRPDGSPHQPRIRTDLDTC